MNSSNPTNRTHTGIRTFRRVSAFAAAGWAAAIFAFSAIPGGALPGRFGPAAHFIVFAVLGALLRVALSGDRRSGAGLLAASAASAYGVTDELHQAFVPMRTPDPIDWLVDSAGAVCGAILAGAVLRLLEKRAAQ